MATIGMDRLFFAPITEDIDGQETYGTPIQMAKAINADLTITLTEATLYADDGLAYVIKDFSSGTLVLGVDDLGMTVVKALTGASVDDNGVLISASEEIGDPVAIGFRAAKPNGDYRYFWFYRVKFGFPAANLQTKGDTITFQTPTLEGTILRRNRLDERGNHPWKAEVVDSEAGGDVIENWYAEVYEPVFETTGEEDEDPLVAEVETEEDEYGQ
jgi:phi13 family phage major tail protein